MQPKAESQLLLEGQCWEWLLLTQYWKEAEAEVKRMLRIYLCQHQLKPANPSLQL